MPGLPSPPSMTLRFRCLRLAARWIWRAGEIALLSALILATRCANHENVFVAGKVYFVDADCYSRMTRARLVAAHPGLIVRHQEFENFPAGTNPHTTAPLDYLIVGLAAVLVPWTAQPLDLAGAFISPLLALGGGWFLWWWTRRMRFRYRWAGLLLFALSPILAHGSALGRPDHQALLLLLVLVALAAEWSLQEQSSAAWNVTSGLSWGLALWVSLYEPLLFFAVLVCTVREKLFVRSRQYAFWGVLFLAAMIERRWPQLPAPGLRSFYLHWSATIGELSPVGLTNPIWLQWFGGFILLAPVLFILARKVRVLPPPFIALLLLAFALTLWEARWGYYLALFLSLAIPALLAVVRQRWLGVLLMALGLSPPLQFWDREIWPNEQLRSARAAERAEASGWRAAASALPLAPGEAFLAPWWLSPSAAYWSGQPGIAGSSHESLPGIVTSARFFLSTQPNEARAILERDHVRWVLAYDGGRTAANAAAILDLPLPPHPLCITLDRAPSQAPPFLSLVGENGTAKLYRVRD